MALDIQVSEVNMFNIFVRLLLWLATLLLLSYCMANKAEAVVGASIMVTKLPISKPPSNCFNSHICLKFDSKRRCVYWAKTKEGKFIRCYVNGRKVK